MKLYRPSGCKKNKETSMTRSETIKCPNCGHVQKAQVTWKQGNPFPTYIHECVQCGYVIMESEWEEVRGPEWNLKHSLREAG